METGAFNNLKGPESRDPDDIQQSGASGFEGSVIKFPTKDSKASKKIPSTPKGVENAKKRLRAFSIQKKSSLSPVSIPKPISSGGATVFIGKASAVKTQPKPEPDPAVELKKPPKPPKPGTKQPQDSYRLAQKKTLGEIEDMKRKMELVELGIPLGLICPAPNSDKAMPTKAMPPIKSFLDPAKVDELIREAKKARDEGKEFKFDYQKLLPDYANPFQRKKDEASEMTKHDENDHRKSRDVNQLKRKEQYDTRRHSFYKRSEKDCHRRDKSKERDKHKENKSSKEREPRSRESDIKPKEKDIKSKDRRDLKSKESDYKFKEKDLKKEEVTKDSHKDEKGADVDLKDFVVCDSWSDNEDKSKESTPQSEERKKSVQEKTTPVISKIDPMEQLRESLCRKDIAASPRPKLKRLNPVIDSFKFEIEDADEDDVLDIIDENSSVDTILNVKPKKVEMYDSPLDVKLFEYDTKDETMDGMADDTFLESVINEIKQEEIDETSQDKGLVEYDESPSKDDEIRDSVTPEIDEKVRELHSSRSYYSDGYKSVDSGCKSVESGYKSTDSVKLSEEFKSESERIEKEIGERKMAKYTVDSLETWSFVLKICQPLLFRHDKNKCYKETRMTPKLWFTENPKLCNCVKDRRVVYEELEMCKMELVDNLCSTTQVQEAAYLTARGWYPTMNQCLVESSTVLLSSEWEAEDSQSEQPPATPERGGDISLDKEYQRFMEAVWPEVADPKSETPRSTPVRSEVSKKKADEDVISKPKAKKAKVTNETWSQESETEEQMNQSTAKKSKVEKQKRKRKHSTSASVTDSSETEAKKRKKMQKKKDHKRAKSKEARRRRVIKKNIKKLKEKQKKKKKSVKLEEDTTEQEIEKENKKKVKKAKKKKQLKLKKKIQKKRKSRAKSISSSSSSATSSSSSSSDSSSESEPEKKSKKRNNSEKRKKRKKSSSESTHEELFDVNILKNIKTERETDDEKSKSLEFSPRKQKPREIINVKELQSDFVGNSIQIKKEVEIEEKKNVEEESRDITLVGKQEEESVESQTAHVVEEREQESELKEQDESQSTPQLRPDESNLSQCSSQESVYSLKDQPLYEKDESHLRPSSQNSNYSFHDVMASGNYSKNIEHVIKDHRMQSQGREIQSQVHEMQNQVHDLQKHDQDMQRYKHDMQMHKQDVQTHEHDVQTDEHDMPRHEHDMQTHKHVVQTHEHDMPRHEQNIQNHGHDTQRHGHGMELHSEEAYEQGNYEMYEQMAMAYQSDVASQQTSPPDTHVEQRIETVVRVRTCGEIKCDWRAGDSVAAPPARPSRWGLKPGDVNIVLTGGGEQSPIRNVVEPVYKIQSIANRTENSATGYDEAYMDMYGASDKLQYGDCFSTNVEVETIDTRRANITKHASSLDDRINLALRTTVLGKVAKDVEEVHDKDVPEKGILVTKSLVVPEGRSLKRVSFADGYKPGQDSDVEDPPVKKKKKVRRVGCAWPCPATHPDHVPLWDALPPPPPPPGSPPPPVPPAPPPAHLLRTARPAQGLLPTPPIQGTHKFDPNSMPAFMPPEPPPGLISFQNM